MPASLAPPSQARQDAEGQSPLFQKLKWLMFLRLLLATGLFSLAIVVQLRDYRPLQFASLLYVVTAATYLLSGIYALLLRRIRQLTALAYAQFLLDAVLISPVVYVTGGIESVFGFLYFWIIISASYLLYTPGAFFAAGLSGLSYAGMVLAQARHFFRADAGEPNPAEDLSYAFYNITINVFAFFLVAFLSSYLAEQLKHTRAALLEEQHNLRELEELNAKIVQNVRTGIATLEPDGRIAFLNRAAEEILGEPSDALVGRNIEELFPGTVTSLEEIRLSDEEILRPTRWDRHYTRRDRQRLYLGFSSSPLKDPDGREVGKILLFEDLTRIKWLEEKTRRDDRLKAVGRMAAGLAHELRNPLASMSGAVQVLKDELELQDENRALMDIVIRETDRLNLLLTDFLHYVRPTPRDFAPVALERIILEVLEAIRHSPRCHPSTQIQTRLEHTSLLLGDTGQLRQILWNLVLNAVEAMPEGGRLEVQTLEAQPQEGGAPRIEIRVLDSGPGITPGVAERLFDPFFSTKAGGTGLGLALVEKLVQAHDGTVRARSGAAGGAIFEVSLPIRQQVSATEEPLEGASAHAG